MTTREFYLSVLDMADTASATDPSMTFGGQSVVDLSAKATQMLAALDAKNEKAKARPKKENAEVADRRAKVVKFFEENGDEYTADEVAEQTGLTAPQVASAVRTMGETIIKGKRKIDSKHSKVTYKRAE